MNCMSVTNNGQNERKVPPILDTVSSISTALSSLFLNYIYSKERTLTEKQNDFFFLGCYLEPFFIDAAGRYLSLLYSSLLLLYYFLSSLCELWRLFFSLFLVYWIGDTHLSGTFAGPIRNLVCT